MNAFIDGFAAGIEPPATLSVSQWADQYRVLSPQASAEPGRWRTRRVPYAREPMDKLSLFDPVTRVVLMWAAQTSKSSGGENWLGYIVHHAPGPMMIVQPTVETAKRFSKQRIAPMIDDTPVLRDRIAESRERDSGNTILTKEFLGGVLIMTGANSAVGLRSMPVRYLFLDEVDAYPDDLDGEGDPVALAEKRTTTFARRKILITSTPTISGQSRIEREYKASDMRRYYVPCPDCGAMQWLRWRGTDDDEGKEHRPFRLVWADEAKTAAAFICQSCGVLIHEHHKTTMLENGEWRPTAEGDGQTAGYHLSGLYSPVGWLSWTQIMREWEAAQHDAPRLKTFVNTVLAETWEENYSMRVDADGIASRAEMYSMLTVPAGGLVITAGVDVQDNRIEIMQRAWGVGEESWLVNYSIIHGDPGQPALWAQVLDVLKMEFEAEGGGKIKTLASCVDTGGHYTHEAYAFCRQHRALRILAVKGQSQSGKQAIGKPSLQDINYRNQKIEKGVELWPVGTDTIKAVVYSRLKNPETGPGCYHWPLGLHAEYYSQLTAEKQVTRYSGGFPRRIWVKAENAANEALDTEVYAYAALQYLYTRTNRVNFWKQMQARLTASGGVESAPIASEPDGMEAIAVKKTPAPVRHQARRGGFVKGWRH